MGSVFCPINHPLVEVRCPPPHTHTLSHSLYTTHRISHLHGHADTPSLICPTRELLFMSGVVIYLFTCVFLHFGVFYSPASDLLFSSYLCSLRFCSATGVEPFFLYTVLIRQPVNMSQAFSFQVC